jgi:carboxypeptidase T
MRRFLLLAAPWVLGSAVSAATFQSVGFYQSFDQLTSWAEQFALDNSDLVSLVEYGHSYQNRPLLALNISLQPGVNDLAKPEFLFTGGIHAREVISSESMYRLAECLVSGYRSGDPAFLDILSEREVWIVPNMNPDGRLAVEGGNSGQRTNLQGVDLNRNFPHRWSETSQIYGDETYGGPSVLSTPEDSALWAMVRDSTKFNDLLGAIDFHSGAQTVISPWISPGEFSKHPLPPADRAKFDDLVNQMSQISGLGTGRLSYNSYGTLADSLYEEFHTYSFIEETYVGPFTDYFTYFNPTSLAGRDERVNRAINSALFLLSDEAFDLVPEPSGPLLLFLAGVAGLFAYRRKRILRLVQE